VSLDRTPVSGAGRRRHTVTSCLTVAPNSRGCDPFRRQKRDGIPVQILGQTLSRCALVTCRYPTDGCRSHAVSSTHDGLILNMGFHRLANTLEGRWLCVEEGGTAFLSLDPSGSAYAGDLITASFELGLHCSDVSGCMGRHVSASYRAIPSKESNCESAGCPRNSL